MIGQENDEASLKEYSSHLLKRYIEEQLVFFPNSIKVLSQWIVTEGCLFDFVIIKNEIPITDMPPAFQTSLNTCMDEEVVNMWDSMNRNLLGAALREMELCVDVYSIPSHHDLIGCSRTIPLYWNPVQNFKRYHTQSPGMQLAST